jgi:hypothetical protein
MNFFVSLIIGNLVGVVLGLTFSLVAEGKIKRNFIIAGVASSCIGWLMGLVLPIHEDRAIGATGFSMMSAFYGTFIYWSSKTGANPKVSS